jgi:hypothetical protein
MDPALTFTVADLADDQAVQLPCACRVRTFSRAELAALVGPDARLHLIGLRRDLWCEECGEAPFQGWVVQHGSAGRIYVAKRDERCEMDVEELRQRPTADDLPPLLTALWWDSRGDWDRAHEIAQSVETADGAWVHAYLHRKEGDLGNADYWYRRAGRRRPNTSLEEEWAGIVAALSA